LPAIIAMTRAYNAQVQGDLSATVRYAELALELIPEDDLYRRAQATITLEATHWSRGDLEPARSALCDWMSSMQKAGNIVFVVASAFALADILVVMGRLKEAIHIYQEAIDIASKNGTDSQNITAHHHLGLAMLYYEMGKDAIAEEHLEKASELGTLTTLVDWSYRWHIAQARIFEFQGNLEAALLELEEAKRAYIKTPVPDVRPTEAMKAEIYLKQGRLSSALDWARVRGISVDDETSYLNEFEHLTLARLMIAESQSSKGEQSITLAIGLLERMLKKAEAQKRGGSVIEILIVQSLAHQAQGNLLLALTALERALILAEPEGYQQVFIDEGEPVKFMISHLYKQIEKESDRPGHPLSDYLVKLLAAFTRPQISTELTTTGEKSELIEPLSQRELEVLRLISLGLSNREIGERLFLALSTVKGHTRIIFDKLQVQNRTEAVARARELNLF